MLTKLETKSNRVKGLCFHPKRPWILASLHNGLIQLWDYRIRTLLEKFDEHDGPVRGINFHASQPLFVSGGDDHKIKVWNYKTRRCLFTLLGHFDYIRTVQFHHEFPWILSSSDDQTIRIWNWQSRTSIAVLSGHNHYVMSAAFHPKEDLVVSASLDQTVRIWDISGLHKKSVSPAGGGGYEDSLRMAQNDLFGNPNVVVKYVLEGHDRGVNWAAFHPTLPLIISGADDRYIKLWRMNDTKAWEVDTLRGHFNNVSCVIFHPRQELIISNSEDKTIRVWDMGKRTGIQTFRREQDRFWILAAHPETNLFAAGHDSGLIVFKLEKERPAYTVYKSTLFYVKDRYLRTYDFATSRDVPVMSLRRTKTTPGAGGGERSVSFNPIKRAVIICSEGDGGSYEVYNIPAEGKSSEVAAPKKGSGVHALWVSRNRFAVLDVKGQQILLNNLMNEPTRRVPTPLGTDAIFMAGEPTALLLKCEEKIMLFDLQQRRSVAEIVAPNVRFVYWSHDSEYVALMAKDTLTIATKRLEQRCTVHETIRMKSGAWTESGVFIYTTLNHIKYCLKNGDNGVVRTLEIPIYITAVRKNKIYCLDREVRHRELIIDPTEFNFKLALLQRRYTDIMEMVRPGHSNLVGQSIIAYLQRKGYPEVALHFVKDEKAKFNLALECGNIEVAQTSAKALDTMDSWHRLGVEALRQGNHQVVEMAYQRTKNFERLSFLYLITGNTVKLQKMLKIAEMRNDTMGRFHNALYLGDVEERVKILTDAGQLSLAYITAANHGLEEEMRVLAEKLEGKVPELPKKTRLLQPPTPILRMHETNWPLLTVSTEWPTLSSTQSAAAKFAPSDVTGGEATPDWDDDGGLFDDEEDSGKGKKKIGLDDDLLGDEGTSGGFGDDTGENLWDDGADLAGLDDVVLGAGGGSGKAAGGDYFVAPRPGPSAAQIWCKNSNLAVDHVVAGSFETAMELYHQQVGIVNFAPLKQFFLAVFMGGKVPLGGVASASPILVALQRQQGFPSVAVNLSVLIDRFKVAFQMTTKGAFAEALVHFTYVLQGLLFVVAATRGEQKEIAELMGFCREYVTGLRMELHKKELGTAKVLEQITLSAYFTHCGLQQVHKMLALRSAMKGAYRIKNYKTAAGFARRLLELGPKPDVATEAKKVVKFAETNNTDQHELNYDERNPFNLCGATFTPIYKNKPSVECPYCHSSFLPATSGKVCPTCQVAEVGKQASGFKVMYSSKD